MIGWLLEKLRGRPSVVRGSGALPEGEARKVTFGDPIAGDGVDLLLCRVDGEIHALDTLCPHEGGRLAPGPLVEGRYAYCPLHAYQFDPKTGRATNAACRKAKVYRAREVDGDARIWV